MFVSNWQIKTNIYSQFSSVLLSTNSLGEYKQVTYCVCLLFGAKQVVCSGFTRAFPKRRPLKLNKVVSAVKSESKQ